MELSDDDFHTGEDDVWYLACNIADAATGQRLAFMNSKGWKQDNVSHSDTSVTFTVEGPLDTYKYDASIAVEPSDGSSPSDFWLEAAGHGGESPDWLGAMLLKAGLKLVEAILEAAE